MVEAETRMRALTISRIQMLGRWECECSISRQEKRTKDTDNDRTANTDVQYTRKRSDTVRLFKNFRPLKDTAIPTGCI